MRQDLGGSVSNRMFAILVVAVVDGEGELSVYFESSTKDATGHMTIAIIHTGKFILSRRLNSFFADASLNSSTKCRFLIPCVRL
jgi:hypothetical protein